MQTTPARPRDKRSRAAEATFRQYLLDQNAKLLDDWLGVTAWHDVRCPSGHEVRIQPYKVSRLARICRACKPTSERSSRSYQSEAKFRKRLVELGAELLGEWCGAAKPHRVRCAAGHECFPKANDVINGSGACSACSGRDTLQAEIKFRGILSETGCTLLESRWLGATRPHLIRCGRGHEMRKVPTLVIQGGRPCRACSGRDPATSFADFCSAVAKLGGQVLEEGWLGAEVPHRVRCAKGHLITPRPKPVLGGSGICRQCTWGTWDAFYVVSGIGGIKLGVTSGDPRPRLGIHRLAGYSDVVRLLVDLPMNGALTLERACLAAMADARIPPVRGREYFPSDALPIAVDIVDGWTSGTRANLSNRRLQRLPMLEAA